MILLHIVYFFTQIVFCPFDFHSDFGLVFEKLKIILIYLILKVLDFLLVFFCDVFGIFRVFLHPLVHSLTFFMEFLLLLDMGFSEVLNKPFLLEFQFINLILIGINLQAEAFCLFFLLALDH